MHARRTGAAVCALVLAATTLGACAGLRESAAVDPMRHAPPRQSATYEGPAPPAAYRADPDAWRGPGLVLPDPDAENDLTRLVDVALAANPRTRRAWEEARAAAARVGRAESPYYPTLSGVAKGERQKYATPSPQSTESFHVWQSTPVVELQWVLLDFGRRGAELERARQQLLAANFAFNRGLQDVVFDVQRSYYDLDAREALVRAAEADLVAATTVAEAARARLSTGLATRPEVLLTAQEEARYAYALEDARGKAESAKADLARSVGIAADLPLRIRSLQDQPLPDALRPSAEALIDEALARRPDLASQLAEVRAKEAELARERARFWPTLSVGGHAGGQQLDYSAGRPGLTYDHFASDRILYGAYLRLEWKLFEGFDRVNAVREARAGMEAARARLAESELDAMAQVWKAYADFKSALRKLDFAIALLASAEEAYDAGLATYRVGLNTITNLLIAQRDLSRGRATLIETRAALLVSSAALAHAAGAMPVGAVGP